MLCENCFCIYWEEGRCVLERITINIQGHCQECIYLSVPEKDLKKAREKILKRYERSYSE